MTELGKKILQACTTSGTSLKAICETSGINYGTLHSQIKNGRPIPFTTIDRLANRLSLGTSHFSAFGTAILVDSNLDDPSKNEIVKKARNQILNATPSQSARENETSTDDILDWLHRENSTLRNYDEFAERIDLFYPVTSQSTTLTPRKIGRKSLAAVYFEIKDVADYSRKIDMFPRETVADLVDAHIQVQRTQSYQIDDMEIAVEVDGDRVSGAYRRLIAPVKDTNGEEFNLVFARLLHAYETKPHVQNASAH